MNGWWATGAVVTAFDTWVVVSNLRAERAELEVRRETMSTCFARWAATPPGLALCVVGWSALSLHLFAPALRRTR